MCVYLGPYVHMCTVKKKGFKRGLWGKERRQMCEEEKKKYECCKYCTHLLGTVLPSGLMSVPGWLVGSQAWLNIVTPRPRGGWPDLKLLPVPLCHPNGSLWSNLIYLYIPPYTLYAPPTAHTHTSLLSSWCPLLMLFPLLDCHLALLLCLVLPIWVLFD